MSSGTVTKVLAIGAALVVAAFASRSVPPRAASGSPSAHVYTSHDAPRALRGKPRSLEELRTTSADIFFENMDGQIGELERLVREHPKNVANVKRLAAQLHTRGRFRGDPYEISRGIVIAESCAAIAPNDPACPLLRAEGNQSLHRFAAARSDLALAKSLGADPSRVRALEADLDWNDGRYDLAIAAIRAARKSAPSTATWIREAQLEHDLGHEPEADAAFEAAEDAIADTSPLVVAHLNVQRGIEKVQTGKLEEACVFFREAIARIPDDPTANEHLAEALHFMGKHAESLQIYEKVTRLSADPEFVHALAELRREAGDTKAADDLDAKARAGYEKLLVAFPEAMYWHASEFFLATGETKKARDLLRKNALLRPNGTSYAALAHAELAAGDLAEAKNAIDRALRMPLVSARLFATAAAVETKKGDTTRAAEHRARALAIDPGIFRDEPRSFASKPAR